MNSTVRSPIHHGEDVELGAHQQRQDFSAAKRRGHGGGFYYTAGLSTTLPGLGSDENVLDGTCRYGGLGFFRAELHGAVLDGQMTVFIALDGFQANHVADIGWW